MIIQAENAAADWVETELARRRLPRFLLGEVRTTERSGTRIVRRDYAWGVVFELHAPGTDRTLICIGEVDEATATVRDPGGRVDTLPLPWKPATLGAPTDPIPEPGGTVPKRRAAPPRAEELIPESSPPGSLACLGRFRTGVGCEACIELSVCRGLQRQAVEAGRTIAEHRALTTLPAPAPAAPAPPAPGSGRGKRKFQYPRRAKGRAEAKALGRRQRRERVDDTMRCLYIDALDVLGLLQADDPERPNLDECWLEERAQGLTAVCQTRAGPKSWLVFRRRPRTGTVAVGTRLPVDSPHWGELAPAVQGYVWGAFVSEVRGVGGTVPVEAMLLAFARAGIEALVGTR